jgi:hypothetical protein
MEQRPLRLGDIVDDYCSRERRLTNHVIVAIVEDAIRQTRCTTCDTEHPYKGGKEPRLRKKPDREKLYDAVLAGVQGPEHPDHPAMAAAGAASPNEPPAGEARFASPGSEVNEDPAAGTPAPEDGWLAHRQLIRATLPRTETDQPVPRPIPEFTMYQRPQPRARFRHGAGHQNGHGYPRNANGEVDGNVNGNGNGNGNGSGNGNGTGRGHGGHTNGSHPPPPFGRPGQPNGRPGRRRRRRR